MSARSTLARLFHRTDEDAMCRVRENDDHQEFARLVKRWEKPIWRLCTRMTGDPVRAEDLKQEVFLRLFETRTTYQPTGRFSTFLWRIALNRCYDELRRQQRRREFLVDGDAEEEAGVARDAAADGPGPDQQAALLEEGRLVRHAVLQLPDIYRAVIVLRHYEGLKLARIAEILAIPEGTVNSRMAEALARLSVVLQPKLKGPVPLKPGQESTKEPPLPSPLLQRRRGGPAPDVQGYKARNSDSGNSLLEPSPPIRESPGAREEQSKGCWPPKATERLSATQTR
ncbi:MAG TPA: RNA polymerase sigma factor [Verrucomicrobiae bacterium]